MVHWWGWLELGRGPQAREDDEGEVVLDVCGRVCLHWNWQVLPVHEGGGGMQVVGVGRDVALEVSLPNLWVSIVGIVQNVQNVQVDVCKRDATRSCGGWVL